MIVTTLLGLFIGSYFTYSKYNGRRASCKSVRKDMEEIASVYDDIVNDFYGEIDKDEIKKSAIVGMVNGLGDKYSAYIDNDAATSLEEELKGKFVGLGVQITGNDKGQVYVMSVFEGSPADTFGIKPLDIITKVDNEEYTSDKINEMSKKIKSSKPGDKKTFEIMRDGKTLTIEVTLDEVILKSVNSYHVSRKDKQIGIMVISTFAENTYDQVVEEYKKLKEVGISSLVLDFRGNGGGYLTSANDIASLFLDKDMVIYRKTDGDKTEIIKNDKDKVIDIPVVLLVDGATESGSELVVSSLHENLNSEIVGTRTYGKGLVQKLQNIGEEKFIKYSVQEWLTSKGEKVEGVGIATTIEIGFDESLEYDNQLETAIDIAANK